MGQGDAADGRGAEDGWFDAPVPPELRGLVASVVGYRQTGGPARVHRGLPSGSLTMIVNVGAPVRVLEGQGGSTFDTTLAGLHISPTLIDDPGTQEGVEVALHPMGVRALLGAPAAALVGAAPELDDVVGPDGRRLWDRLQAPADLRSRTDACLRWLTGRLGAGGQQAGASREVRRAWTLLATTDGRARIADIAHDVGWSRQHLRRRFRAEVGLNPKETGRILRFDASVRRLKADPCADLGTVAADCGYADQAHLTNEWSRLAGCSPSSWMTAELVPKVQDGQTSSTS